MLHISITPQPLCIKVSAVLSSVVSISSICVYAEVPVLNVDEAEEIGI